MAERFRSVSYSFSSSFGRQISYAENFDKIQELVNVHERGGKLDNSSYHHVEITKSHWMKASDVTYCSNPACNKKFALLERKRNCRMCGCVFCRACTEYERRLSAVAMPDPLGKLYPVCKTCHCTGEQTIGKWRNSIEYFRSIRYKVIRSLKQHAQQNIRAKPAHKYDNKVDYTKECLRLTVGFQSHCNALKQAFNEVTGKVPDWQKSPHWCRYDKAQECAICGKNFSMLTRKIHCRVCSKLCCTGCVKEDLLLYINEDGESKWGLNGVVAFTTKPSKYCLLFACSKCRPELEQCLLVAMKKEEEELEDIAEENEHSVTFFEQFIPVQSNLWNMQCDISNWLPNFTKDVDYFTEPNASAKVVGMHSLTKANIDLSDTFSKLSITSQKLRTFRPTTKGEAVVLNNCVKGTLLFYSENMYLFRKALKSLNDFAPADVLTGIQAIVGETTIRNVLTLCKSICFNVIMLEKEYAVNQLVQLLTDLVESLEDDLKIALEQSKGEDYEETVQKINEIVQLELKSRRRIRGSRSKSGAAVFKQCAKQLNSCRRELEAKTPKKEFQNTKEMLKLLSGTSK